MMYKAWMVGTLMVWNTILYALPVDDLKSRLSFQTMQAHFKQDVYARSHGRTHSSGFMMISRPGKFRWQTEHPMQQWIIANGKTLWIYDVELEQVTVKKQTQVVNGIAALFLNQDIRDLNHYTITYTHQGDVEKYRLIPQRSHDFAEAELVFRKGVLTTLVLEDKMHQKTHIHFTGVQLNHAIAARWFVFHMPKGVDVVNA